MHCFRFYAGSAVLHQSDPYTLGFSQASFQEELAAAWSGAIGFSKKQALISGMASMVMVVFHGEMA